MTYGKRKRKETMSQMWGGPTAIAKYKLDLTSPTAAVSSLSCLREMQKGQGRPGFCDNEYITSVFQGLRQLSIGFISI